jgi:large subunit ribosomal protein L6
MSRLYRDPIYLDPSLKVEVDGSNVVRLSSAKNTWSKGFHPFVKIEVTNEHIKVGPMITEGRDHDVARMHAGTAYSIIKSACLGLVTPFKRKLIFVGVGYRCKVTEKKIDFNLNFSHPVSYVLPGIVEGANESPTILVLTSFDKEILGKVCSEIRSIRAPERYKGKGIRYENEVIITKTAKKKAK